MILAAAGAVDHDAICRQAERLMGHLAPIQPPVQERAAFAGGERREIRPLEQVHFALALESPCDRDDEVHVAQVHATLLGGGMSSRLFQEAREKRGLCYTIFAQAGAYADTGMLTIYAGTGGAEARALADLTVDELKRVASDVTEAEVARARAQLKAGLLMGLESPSNRAERLARLVSIWGRVPAVAETVARIEAVDRAAVARFGERAASAGPAALALYGPAEGAPHLAEIQDRLAA